MRGSSMSGREFLIALADVTGVQNAPDMGDHHECQIDAELVAQMKPSAVVPLMYESWEFREQDVDLDACRRRGIAVAGTTETHPAVDVFSFLGPMAVKQLHDVGVAVHGARIGLLCDNPFEPHLTGYLRRCGAQVVTAHRLTRTLLRARCDAVILALRPRREPMLAAPGARRRAGYRPGPVLGYADRAALAAAGVPVWPPRPPGPGTWVFSPPPSGRNRWSGCRPAA